MQKKINRLLKGAGIALLFVVMGYIVIRPWHLTWGTAAEDRQRIMPGDLAGARWTRSILIAATPEQIWPWLVQWGQGRGGWYSYDWLENLFGFDIHSSEQILAEHQNPQIGDPICMAANACASLISVIEDNQWFGWQSKDETGKPVWTFMLGLIPVDAAHTRLIVRESFDLPPFITTLIEIPDVVMELKSLNTVKDRAEGRPASGFSTVYEIVVWLTALAIGLAAGVLFVNRDDGMKPLAVGLAAVLVLLVFTFLFPPYWLRGVLAAGLIAGFYLVWREKR